MVVEKSLIFEIKTEEEGSSFSQAVILDDENNEIHQLKQFPFSSEYARSSVLVRTVSRDGESIGDLEVLVKGRDSLTTRTVRDY